MQAPSTAISTQPPERAAVYIDGFNLYRGAIAGSAHKWLNIQRYFELLRNAEDLVQIHYFTAPMHGAQGQRQAAYLQALATLPKVNVILGKYKTKRVRCNVSACLHAGDRRFVTFEEKRTDVNIAVRLLDDAYQDVCDVVVVVSGDSDLVPALHQIKLRFPSKKLVVYVPARSAIRGAAVEIRSAADKHATLPLALLQKCHFPPNVPDGAGGFIKKPMSW